MDTRFFDVLHDPGDKDVTRAVTHRVYVDFDRVFEKTIEQNGPTLTHASLARQ